MADIFPFTPDGDVSESDKSVVTVLGTGTQFRVLNRRGQSYTTLSFNYEQYSVAERQGIEAYFKQKMGKYIPFWVRSYHTEVELTEEGIAGQPVIYTKVTDLALTLEEKPVFLYFRELDWAARVLQVEAGRTDPDTGAVISSRLTLSSTLPASASVGCNVERLFYVRFDQDSLSFSHKEMNKTTCKFKFRELPSETPSIIVHP